MAETAMSVAEVAIAVLTLIVVLLNAFYVRKFSQSVDITRKQLETMKESTENAWKIAQGTMLLQTNRDFFYQEPHKKIIRAIERGIDVRAGASGITDADLDDHIGFLDTIGTFVRANILDERLVWDVFSHYIESAHENDKIAEYMQYARREDKDFFNDFTLLYKKMKAITKSRE